MPANLKTKIVIDSKQFDKTIQVSSKQIQVFQKNVNVAGKSVMSFAKGFVALSGVSLALNDMVKTSVEFQKSLSGIQSLLGITTEELKFFEIEAIRLGSTTTQTASQVAKAFQLIGSTQPELLKNKTALVEVTEAAIVLAEAAGIEVPEAAKALSGSINQMGANASKATEYINILAAASQNGSADIPYLNAAIEKAGGTASSVGVEFHELVASIEAIAPKITEASTAGLNLRNIFLTLEKSTDSKLKPTVVGFTKALENLAAKQMDVTQLTEMFGKQNVTAALALIKAKDNYLQLTQTIVGTNTAYEQQKINTDNVAGSMNALQSAWEGFTLTVNKSNGQLKDSLDFLTAIVSRMTELTKASDVKHLEDVTKATKQQTAAIDDNVKMYKQLGQTEKEAVESTKKITKELLNSAEERLSGLEKQQSLGGKWDNKQLRESIAHWRVQIDAYKEGLRYLADYNTEAKKTDSSSGETPADAAAKRSPKGSAGWIAEEIKLYQEKLSVATDEATRNGFRKAIEDLEKQKKLIELEATLRVVDLDSPKIPGLALPSREKKINQLVASDIQNGNIGSLTDTVKNSNHVQTAILEDYLKRFSEKNDLIKQDQNVLDYLTAISSLTGSISQATDNAAASWLSYSSNLLATIATMMPQLAALFKVKWALAMTESAQLPPPLNIISIGTTLAALGAAVSAIPKFESGGIVPGTSFTGDKVLSRLNSGEMVLNKRQQSNLFDMLSNGQSPAGSPGVSTVRVKGADLYLALSNYQKRTGKIR